MVKNKAAIVEDGQVVNIVLVDNQQFSENMSWVFLGANSHVGIGYFYDDSSGYFTAPDQPEFEESTSVIPE
ncbi:hypothetical protein CHH28_03835 [Bacterioplanes sanyensis]|uniref:Uncharacterized protein n=2 Tax=Bacterioplanes sanyensis TaxID=1249553 RepID=A0A222FGZ5_9GAMM|nr:hypothetical protein CHH28_03835 [Bacterioplanes sanyensis]